METNFDGNIYEFIQTQLKCYKAIDTFDITQLLHKKVN